VLAATTTGDLFDDSLSSFVFGSFFFDLFGDDFACVHGWAIIYGPAGGFVVGAGFEAADCLNLVLLNLILSLFG